MLVVRMLVVLRVVVGRVWRGTLWRRRPRRAGCPHVDCVTCRSGTSVERDFVEAPSQMCWLSACRLCYVS